MYSQGAGRSECWCLAHFLLVYSVWGLAHGMVFDYIWDVSHFISSNLDNLSKSRPGICFYGNSELHQVDNEDLPFQYPFPTP